MSRMPRVSGKNLLNAFLRGGFKLIYIRGSHHYVAKNDEEKLVTIPVHSNKILKPKTLKNILERAELSIDDLILLL
jgi:predicted RNA binding protein YcfA (HicA-like mRNA interferase family)